MRVLATVDVLAEGSGSALGHVCGVGHILRIDEEELITHILILLLPQERVFQQRRLLIPMNQRIILLQNPM